MGRKQTKIYLLVVYKTVKENKRGGMRMIMLILGGAGRILSSVSMIAGGNG